SSYSSSENKYYAIISMSYLFLSCTKKKYYRIVTFEYKFFAQPKRAKNDKTIMKRNKTPHLGCGVYALHMNSHSFK
ncbi:hypothetical protein, partial [Acinetobacter towneri]|uniref:hypothetical protein n=1 Tax=Acinetobacter towneri TaxID=202956 RepID=UPI003A842D04